MSIYITGDTHIPTDISKLSTKKWHEQKELSHDDFLIICGDFGAVWNNSPEDKYWQKWLDEKPFTTLFVDGNHENFNLLNEYEVEEFHGGKIHRIMPNVCHLMRGQVFNFNGTKVFTMGGAESSDIECRKENISWWKQELPNDDEYNEAIRNLEKCDWKVDLVITHCTSTDLQHLIFNYYPSNRLTDFFQEIKSKLSYNKWYFGHYHINKNITDKDTAIFYNIEKYEP